MSLSSLLRKSHIAHASQAFDLFNVEHGLRDTLLQLL
jgi:hypothetical protein